jgi:hypothetical protein
MKAMLKKMLQSMASTAAGPMHRELIQKLSRCETEIRSLQSDMRALTMKVNHPSFTREAQIALYLTYKDMVLRKVSPLPDFREVGFRCHSQFEEDGILLFLFAVIGTTNKTSVEICAGNGVECMTTNLILNHGWWGHLFDGEKEYVEAGTRFFKDSLDTFIYPPRFTHAWVTAENVNQVIRSSGVEGEIDLLSLDIDGMDYWVWRAIDCIMPRVVVCETHGIIGPDDALTVPYDPNFRNTTPDYCGASLAAMTALASEKGYRLVGTHRYGFNAFFVRRGIAEDLLPTVTPSQCLGNPFLLEERPRRWSKLKDMKWERI